jgi:hypothetical protein
MGANRGSDKVDGIDPDDWEALGEHGHALAELLLQQQGYRHEEVDADATERGSDREERRPRRKNRPAVAAGLHLSTRASRPDAPLEERKFHVAANSTVIHLSPDCPRMRAFRSADTELTTFEVTLGNAFCARRGLCRTCIKSPELRSEIGATIRRLHARRPSAG